MPPLNPNVAEVIKRTLPWARKSPKAFWRGAAACQGGILGFPPGTWCARSYVSRLAQIKYPEQLDVGLTEEYYREDEIELDATLRDGHGPLPVLEPVSWDALPTYRYLLHLDGHTAAHRLANLLAVDSLVLRQESPYFEYYYRSLKPYKHYVPIFNYTLHDLMPALAWAKDPGNARAVADIIQEANAFALQYTTLHARILYIKYALLAYRSLFADMQSWFESGGSTE